MHTRLFQMDDVAMKVLQNSEVVEHEVELPPPVVLGRGKVCIALTLLLLFVVENKVAIGILCDHGWAWRTSGP